jgi:hypothetical protein
MDDTTTTANFEEKRFQLLADREKSRRCPTCGAQRTRESLFYNAEQGLMQMLREQQLIGRESCIECVEKHVGQAMVKIAEISSGYPTYHLLAVGHLQEAWEESTEYTELHDYLLEARRDYQREGKIPDWTRIAEMITEVKSGK